MPRLRFGSPCTTQTTPAPQGYGYRVWVTEEQDSRVVLRGITVPEIWRPGINTAACANSPPSTVDLWMQYGPRLGRDLLHDYWDVHDKGVPAPGCQCGFWSLPTLVAAVQKQYYTAPLLRSYINKCMPPPSSFVLVGAIRYWGKTIVHTDGTRAHHAQVLALLQQREWVGGVVHLPGYVENVRQAGRTYDVPVFGLRKELEEFVADQRLSR